MAAGPGGDGYPGGDSLLTPISPQIPAGTPLFETFSAYEAVPPFGFKTEFRPLAIEDFTETIEGDNSIQVVVAEDVAIRLLNNFWSGPFSIIISLLSNVRIHRVWDREVTEAGSRFSSYVYDSYYVKQIKQEQDSRNYRLICGGLKEYLGKRLAIPAGRNTVNGVVNVPDGSQASKPIPNSQILKYTGKTPKGIIAGLITESKLLQDIPVGWTPNGMTGDMQRTYLLKDFRSIKESINNMLDDNGGPEQIVFDGGFGTRDAVGFVFNTGGYQKGYPYTNLSARSANMFKPQVETVVNEVVNNIWTVGNAADGNILLCHKIQDGSAGKVLLQEANTERNDIQTSSFLLEYTTGILQRSGQEVITINLKTGLTQDMLLAFVGNYLTITAPEEPQIDGFGGLIVQRTIDMDNRTIEFDLVQNTYGEEESE